MTRIITFLVLMILGQLSAQNTVETQLKDALLTWNSNDKEKALPLFDEVAEKYADNWLANYYVAYANVVTAFSYKEQPETLKVYLDKAQTAQDKVNLLEPNNAEVLVVQALINTGYIIYNPMQNGRTYSEFVQKLYKRALLLAPENPRVLLCKTEFEVGMTRYMGGDVKPFCNQFLKAKELFSTFKPESDLHPNWGTEKLENDLLTCN
ncbi:tetratricopeptide repeat protein [Flavobacterium sp.]|uniref:tetratricopeptide repeat protein n=1 Tax=Flavobacterium sp. TaxID=239 RepID=UPI003529A11A